VWGQSVGVGAEGVVGVGFHDNFYDVESEVAEYEAWDSREEQVAARVESAEADGGNSCPGSSVDILSQLCFDVGRESGKRWDCPVPAWPSEVDQEVDHPGEAFSEGGRVGLPVVFHARLPSAGRYRS